MRSEQLLIEVVKLSVPGKMSAVLSDDGRVGCNVYGSHNVSIWPIDVIVRMLIIDAVGDRDI